ncbi:TlpA disulfide reductase family protein [Cerasicoccus frondis]|uniref:TlpA disulfide reductase family protein n=1 Tax=Cerasicoccus frondis TaxID=490090 RepID=UPI002852D5AF|nr:TlpA disulfide reductase family protein [Cerasicoccus frondis]
MNLPVRLLRLSLPYFILLVTVLAQARTFTMKDGEKIEGTVVSFKNGMIVLAKDGGGKSLHSLETFSPADQAYLNEKFPSGDKRESVRATATATPAPTPGPTVETTPPTPRQTAPQSATQAGHPGLTKLRAGSLAPEVKARPQGKPDFVTNRDMTGKIVVVHFWSTSVQQSLEELKGLAYLYHKYHDRGFELIGVAMDSSRRRVNGVEEAIGVTWPMRMDEERETIAEWGVTALPTNVLIDQVGVIQRPHISARELQYFLADQLGPAN